MVNTPIRLALLCASLLAIIYFGFNTVAPDIHQAANVRMKNLDVTGLENLEEEYYPGLSATQKAELSQLSKEIKNSGSDQEKAEKLKSVSGFWFKQGVYSLAGSYARKVAELNKEEEAWQIAGTTFLYCLESETDLKKKKFCQQGAIHCLEQASSLNTSEPSHQLNLAMAYVKLPGDDPMQGIKLMLSLEKKHPDYLPLQLQLAELGLETGQFEKAQLRLEKVLDKEPENIEANCLMVQLLEKTNQADKAKKYQLHCK